MQTYMITFECQYSILRNQHTCILARNFRHIESQMLPRANVRLGQMSLLMLWLLLLPMVVVVVVVEMNIIKVALSHCCCKTTHRTVLTESVCSSKYVVTQHH